MIQLNQEQVKQIEVLIGEMPGKFAISLLNILNEASSNNNAPADSVQPSEEV
jgi:hypothetical protein